MNKYQDYMKNNHGIFVCDDEAQIHLESFATLFLALKPETAEADGDVLEQPYEHSEYGTSTEAPVDSAVYKPNPEGRGVVLPPTLGNGK